MHCNSFVESVGIQVLNLYINRKLVRLGWNGKHSIKQAQQLNLVSVRTFYKCYVFSTSRRSTHSPDSFREIVWTRHHSCLKFILLMSLSVLSNFWLQNTVVIFATVCVSLLVFNMNKISLHNLILNSELIYPQIGNWVFGSRKVDLN